MITEEKIQMIRRRLKKGVPQGEIENELRKEGLSEEEIKLIYEPFESSKMRSWYLFFGIFFLASALFSFVAGKDNLPILLIIAAAILLCLFYKETNKMSK